MTAVSQTGFASAADLPEALRGHLGSLLLVMADNKRLLGMRYSEWILGAPTLEAGISCSAMAQDEWGHSRILYAMLKDFGEDPGHLEHEREAEAYCGSELLDSAAGTWAELLALNLLLDAALTVQFEALLSSRFEPLHYKMRKLLEEERFHAGHGRGWVTRLAETDAGRDALRSAFAPAWTSCLRWFGREDSEIVGALLEAGIVDADPNELRRRWLSAVGPAVADARLGLVEADESGHPRSTRAPDWEDWDPARRRAATGGPDASTLARVRGDLNRALLLD
ncbi:MAG: Phenylacetic acid catabolic protein [Gemmatimonadota bacterium]